MCPMQISKWIVAYVAVYGALARFPEYGDRRTCCAWMRSLCLILAPGRSACGFMRAGSTERTGPGVEDPSPAISPAGSAWMYPERSRRLVTA